MLTFLLKQNHGGWNSDDLMTNNLGRFRLAVTDGRRTRSPIRCRRRVRDILAVPREQRTPAQIAAVFCYWRTTVPEWKEANDRIEALWKQRPDGRRRSWSSQARDEPRDDAACSSAATSSSPAGAVAPGVPGVPAPAARRTPPPTRLTLARWLVDPQVADDGARVRQPRLAGLLRHRPRRAPARTSASQSEAPSHPELLDWLAVRVHGPAAGASRHLHRLIVTSATYRQSRKVTPELLAKDPYNRLLARGAAASGSRARSSATSRSRPAAC